MQLITQPFSWKMGAIRFALLCYGGAVYLFLTFYMLLAILVYHKVCKTYFVSFTNKENIKFDIIPLREIDKKQIYPYHS